MSTLASVTDLKNFDKYRKDVVKSLSALTERPTKMFYLPAFEFSGKKGPLVLMGELTGGLARDLKNEKLFLKPGKCRRGGSGSLEVMTGLVPAKIGQALRFAGINETVSEKEIPDVEEAPGPQVGQMPPVNVGAQPQAPPVGDMKSIINKLGVSRRSASSSPQRAATRLSSTTN